MQTNRKKELQNKVASGFLGFWIKNYRLSYLATAVVLLLGALSIVQIPKESMPEVDLGMVMVTTAYPGASPEDVDTLVTDKIYKAIKDVKGIDKITSTSSLGISTLQISGETGYEIKDLRTDIQSKIESVSLPSDARDPNVSLVETNANMTFSMYIFDKNNSASKEALLAQAKILQKKLEDLPKIDEVKISYAPTGGGLGSDSDDSDYEVQIRLDHTRLESYGLTLAGISSQIQAFNTDMPIGNFDIESRSYDYRISGKNTNASEFLKTPISLPNGGTIPLGNIAELHRKYKAEKTAMVIIGGSDNAEHDAVGLSLSKTDSASIFGAASEAKQEIENIFKTEDFKNF